MTIRENTEQFEHLHLSSKAAFSDKSKGRNIQEPKDDILTDYRIDIQRIQTSKAFRRLSGKTQVFLNPVSDHYRNRMTHTLEVAGIAEIICESLHLNTVLARAIALGHDLGHTPFGHSGERALNRITGHFEHCEQSLRVVDEIENLNLTWEVKDGILNHRSSGKPSTLEGQVVQFADKIAYLTHDMNDSIRAGILIEDDIPLNIQTVLGTDSHTRQMNLIRSVINGSHQNNLKFIQMEPEQEVAFATLRDFMFENVYHNPIAKQEEGKAEYLVIQLYEYCMSHPTELTNNPDIPLAAKKQLAVDYIAGMTDDYAIRFYQQKFMPKSW